MKKIVLLMTCMIIFLVSNIVFSEKVNAQSNTKIDYLKMVLNNLDQIKSATYLSTKTAYQPYDSIPYAGGKQFYYKWFDNPADTSVGASFVKLYKDDTTKMQFAYDGNVRVLVYDEKKAMVIDNFEINRWPYRIVYPPIISRAKSIIKFAYETKDSVLIESKDLGNQIQFIISIYDHRVDFVGKIPVYETPYGSSEGEVTKYEIWVDKSTKLPFKIIKEFPTLKAIEIVEFITFNELRIEDFKISDYYLPDYKLRKYGKSSGRAKNELEGKKAPEWILKNADNNFIDFKDLKSKVLLIEFTGIGCGPCKKAIPFLKELVVEYKEKDFELISIETWNSNFRILKNYQEKNEFNFKFLNANESIKKDYKISSVPIFFILDENRLIKKIIKGFGGTADKQIRDAINELI